jgi:serine/threonine protein kinase
MEPIPIVSDVRPLADPAFTRAPEPLPDTCYLKHQNFLSYMDATDRPEFATLILTEVEACEVLRLHPHPNIAPYLGCVVENSHIKGPCFPKYSTILAHMLKDKVEFDRAFVQRDIEAGVEHMHKLGLLHGDLNPTSCSMETVRSSLTLTRARNRARSWEPRGEHLVGIWLTPSMRGERMTCTACPS